MISFSDLETIVESLYKWKDDLRLSTVGKAEESVARTTYKLLALGSVILRTKTVLQAPDLKALEIEVAGNLSTADYLSILADELRTSDSVSELHIAVGKHLTFTRQLLDVMERSLYSKP